MSTVYGTIGAITLFVDDVDRAKSWYVTTFGTEIVFEDPHSAVIQFANTIINLLHRSAADELVGPARVAPTGSGAQLQFTIWVPNVDDALAELHARGVTLVNGPLNRSWGQRTICFADPDGHLWEVAQQLG